MGLLGQYNVADPNYFANTNNYQSGFIGPVQPGQTIGGQQVNTTPITQYNPGSSSYWMNNQTSSPAPAGQVKGISDAISGSGSGGSSGSGGGSGSGIGTGSQPSYEDRIRGQIESGYNAWEGGMNNIFNELPNQAANQNQIINNQYQQGYNTLTNQRNQGQDMLKAQEAKTTQNQESNLKSLADSLRNQFLQGQVMLGQRGAGDSSAANMYSYALTKLGSKERSSIMNNTANILGEIGQRETKLKQDYDTGIQNLGLERDNKISQVAQWLSEQQNAVRSQIAEGKLRKSSEIAQMSQNFLNQALSYMQQIQGQFTAQKNALDTWAMNNSKTIEQLKSNLSGTASFNPTMPQFQGIFGQPTMDAAGNMAARFYGGYSEDEKKQV